MVIKFTLPAVLLLAGCTPTHVDICKYAALTRVTLRASIAATQAVIDDKVAHGKSVSNTLAMSLQATQASLFALDTKCPNASFN